MLFVDNLRVLLISMVVIQHVAVTYGYYLLHERGIANGPVWFIALLLLFSLIYGAWRVLTR